MVRVVAGGHASRMTSAPLPGTPLPTAPARPALRRSATDRMVGGVCGGLADYSGIDSLLWRVGFVGLTIAGGAGIIVYLLLWVFMASAPLPPGETPSPIETMVGRLHDAVSGLGK
jgi:phage shock protein PspC (stress-responsive transcriptional regulator)